MSRKTRKIELILLIIMTLAALAAVTKRSSAVGTLIVPHQNSHKHAAQPSTTTTFIQTNLVSDVPGMAKTTDPNLVNPWGRRVAYAIATQRDCCEHSQSILLRSPQRLWAGL